MSFVGQGMVEGDAEVYRCEVVLQSLAIHQDCEFASCSCILQVKALATVFDTLGFRRYCWQYLVMRAMLAVRTLI